MRFICFLELYLVIKHEVDVNVPPQDWGVHPGIYKCGDLVSHVHNGYGGRYWPTPALCEVHKPLKTFHGDDSECRDLISFLI